MLDVKDFLRWLSEYEATFSGDRFPTSHFLGLIDRYREQQPKPDEPFVIPAHTFNPDWDLT